MNEEWHVYENGAMVEMYISWHGGGLPSAFSPTTSIRSMEDKSLLQLNGPLDTCLQSTM